MGRKTNGSGAKPAQGQIETRTRERLLAHLRSQATVQIGKWTREELYEDEPVRPEPRKPSATK
jgi:hypothetical protein